MQAPPTNKPHEMHQALCPTGSCPLKLHTCGRPVWLCKATQTGAFTHNRYEITVGNYFGDRSGMGNSVVVQ